MNPDTKQFEPLPDDMNQDDPRQSWPKFKVGQGVVIEGVAFVIRKITKKDLVLRPKGVVR